MSPTAQTLWWVLSIALIVVGLVGTVMPALPGTLFVLAGIVLAAWIEDFQRIGGWTIGIAAALTVLSFVLDYAAGILGAKKVRASRNAIIGAAVGTVVGLAMGIVGVLFMPLVGAAIGQYIEQNDHKHAMKVGVATWIGTMVGMAAKVAIAFMMIGLLVVALVVK
jgi:uncharacterized protein